MTQRRTTAYLKLGNDLRNGVLKGRYRVGDQLPTEAELMKQYSVSRQTVRRAFHDLVSEGIVVRAAGRGTFVAPKDGQYLRQFGSIDDLMALSSDTKLETLVPLRRHVDVVAASRLGLKSDTVISVSFQRTHNGLPLCITTVYLPPEFAHHLDDVAELRTEGAKSDITVIGLLDARLPDPITEAEQSITACAAPPTVARRLGCDAAAPVLRIDRLYRAETEGSIELAVSYFLCEHYSYRVKLRRSAQ
jgi:GntR family transcriptional regulator